MAAQASQQFGDGILTALDQRDAATSPQGADRLGKHHRLDLGRRKDCDDGTPLGFGERGAQATLEAAQNNALRLGTCLERGKATREEQRLGALIEQPHCEVLDALHDLIGPPLGVGCEGLIGDNHQILFRQLSTQELGSTHPFPALCDDSDWTSRVGAPSHDRCRFFSGS